MKPSWPDCANCGRPLPQPWRSRRAKQKRTYCSTRCVPNELRAANGRRAREVGTQRARLRLYRDVLKRLQSLERITGEDLMAAFAEIGTKKYRSGYSACESKWRRLLRHEEAA